ncbi:MAG: hypothetical protein KGI35_03595, partial [Burkholderiales bacterium]|nr:hypothetical protein [Burkholderiales bacterium]
QNAVAQMEKRSDLLLSTLRKYVEAMGGELAVAVRTGVGTVIMLDSLSSLSNLSAPKSRSSSQERRPETRSAGKAKAKRTGTEVA